MALANVIGSGTYGYIPNITIDRTNKYVQFTFSVYTNANKVELIFSRDFSLNCLGNYRSTTSCSKRAPDGLEVDQDYFFIPPDVNTGEWAQYAGNFLQYFVWDENEYTIDENGNPVTNKVRKTQTSMIECVEGTVIFAQDEGKTYRIKEDKGLTHIVVGSSSDWINYFQPSVSTAPGTNIVAQCYEWLKNTGLYPNAIDI